MDELCIKWMDFELRLMNVVLNMMIVLQTASCRVCQPWKIQRVGHRSVLLKNDDFRLKNDDLLLTIVEFIMNLQRRSCWRR